MSSVCVSYCVCTCLTKTVLTIIYFLKRQCTQMYDLSVCLLVSMRCLWAQWLSTMLQCWSQPLALLLPFSPSLSLSFLPYPCTIIIFPRYITTCVDEYFITNHNLADCYNLAQGQAVALPISCSEAGTVRLNNRGSLSLHILSKLPHQLHAGWRC